MSNSWSNTSDWLILLEARPQEIKSGDGGWGGPHFLVLLEQDTGLTQVQRKICRFVLDKPRTEESKSNKSEVKRKDELMGQDTILGLQTEAQGFFLRTGISSNSWLQRSQLRRETELQSWGHNDLTLESGES